jgi:hypothetical protein
MIGPCAIADGKFQPSGISGNVEPSDGASRLLLPVSVCCANIAFLGDFYMFRFTFLATIRLKLRPHFLVASNRCHTYVT